MHSVTSITFFISSWICFANEVFASDIGVNVCDLPKVVGSCNARIIRFYFNGRTGHCVLFFYSGCDGNDNNFETRDKCKKACRRRVCSLPKEMGPCEAAIRRWFYNIKTMQCERFIYGGCQGNKNNFPTKRRCKRRCRGVKQNQCPPGTPCAPPPPNGCQVPSFVIVNGEKCSFGCKYRRCKKGNCPKQSTPGTCMTAEPKCRIDRDCQGPRLCCSGCCENPVLEPKTGNCPADQHQSNCPVLKSECDRDGQCAGRRKCCQLNCRKFCVDPEF